MGSQREEAGIEPYLPSFIKLALSSDHILRWSRRVVNDYDSLVDAFWWIATLAFVLAKYLKLPPTRPCLGGIRSVDFVSELYVEAECDYLCHICNYKPVQLACSYIPVACYLNCDIYTYKFPSVNGYNVTWGYQVVVICCFPYVPRLETTPTSVDHCSLNEPTIVYANDAPPLLNRIPQLPFARCEK